MRLFLGLLSSAVSELVVIAEGLTHSLLSSSVVEGPSPLPLVVAWFMLPDTPECEPARLEALVKRAMWQSAKGYEERLGCDIVGIATALRPCSW
jgi:hypothetical protein